MFYKKFVKSTLLAIFIPFFSFVVTIIIIDPLQILHKNFFHPELFFKECRLGSFAVLKQVDFDSVIIGSCLLMNTSANEASKKLGGRFVNLSFDGGVFSERCIILRKAFSEKKNIKTVIFTIDPYFYLTKTRFDGSVLDGSAHLYKSRRCFTTLEVYFSHSRMLYKWIRDFFSKNPGYFSNSLDKQNAWRGETFGGFDKWIDVYKSAKTSSAYKGFLKNHFKQVVLCHQKMPKRILEVSDNKKQFAREVFEESLIPLIQEHPETTFHLIIPPYSKLFYRTDYYGRLAITEYVIKWLIGTLSKYKNVYIYGYNNERFTFDISNYKDFHHHSSSINEFILNSIYNRTHILNESNVDNYFKKMETESIGYDLKPFFDKIKCLDIKIDE